MRTALALVFVLAFEAVSFGCVDSKCDCQGSACETCSGIATSVPPLDGGQADVATASE